MSGEWKPEMTRAFTVALGAAPSNHFQCFSGTIAERGSRKLGLPAAGISQAYQSG
jgi:hypothetical protein